MLSTQDPSKSAFFDPLGPATLTGSTEGAVLSLPQLWENVDSLPRSFRVATFSPQLSVSVYEIKDEFFVKTSLRIIF